MIIPVILAGGSGTRLWPFSRKLYPKQLLPLVDDRTLLQNTILRLNGLGEIADPIVICNEEHRFLVAEQFRAINAKPASIILEPVGRNTAPAVAVAALQAVQKDERAVLLVLPADHHIENVEAFHRAVQKGLPFARENYLLAFGITPDAAETGYGYIQGGDAIKTAADGPEAVRIGKFVEKPDKETAQAYLDSGSYFWNSGMFMFRGSRILEELSKFAPDLVSACKSAFEKGVTDLDFFRLDAGAFQACPSDSIDYAVMERTQSGAMITLSAGWNDLGSWDALWEVQTKDENQNVVLGDVLAQDIKRCYIQATSRLVAAIGLEGHIIIETPDAVLISKWDRAQEVKNLVQQLKELNREEVLNHQKVFRPWGSYERLNLGNRFQVKRLTVKPGAKLSLQRHHHRAEHWVIVHGTARVTNGDKQYFLNENESTYIPFGSTHRLENPGKIPLEVIEVQSGSYLGEDDIFRLEDDYRREQH
jgi:mannose-1-phosphate guanylyltransferase/mannose-6-phosphate isomerase